ncbi:hypothetical protein A2U01_0107283, partial [Trifolium medium]|nr:hypothetical protein [Trifolium medium]
MEKEEKKRSSALVMEENVGGGR